MASLFEGFVNVDIRGWFRFILKRIVCLSSTTYLPEGSCRYWGPGCMALIQLNQALNQNLTVGKGNWEIYIPEPDWFTTSTFVEVSSRSSNFFNNRKHPWIDNKSWFLGTLIGLGENKAVVIYTPWVRPGEVNVELILTIGQVEKKDVEKIISGYINNRVIKH